MTLKNQPIQELLIQNAELAMQAPYKLPELTDDVKANELVTDLKGYPHAYVIACIMDRQIQYKLAWRIPYELRERLGHFDFSKLEKISEEEMIRLMREPTVLHRYPKTMGKAIVKAIALIRKNYDGDASRIWADNPSSELLVKRFSEFHGAGPKIATMAANILMRELRIPVSDRSSIDISADVHVVRVFERLGFVPQDSSLETVIFKAREMHPEYPGIFDLGIWSLGHDICIANNPKCRECYLSSMCPSCSG